MEFSELQALIRRRLAEVGSSQHRVALKNNLPQDAIRNVLAGHVPRLDRAAEICQALDIPFRIGPPRTPSHLKSEARHSDADPPESAAQTPTRYGADFPLADVRAFEGPFQALVQKFFEAGGNPFPPELRDTRADYEFVPRYDVWLAPGHGIGETVEQASEAGYELFRRQWLRDRGLEGHELSVVDVVGNSMAPTLCDGDWTLVDRSQRQLRHGGIFALSGGPVPLLRRIREAADGWWADSDNDNNGYPSLALSQRDEVIGRVVWWAHTEWRK